MKQKALMTGVLAGTSLLLFYLIILTLFNGLDHALQQLNQFLPLISLLVIGFGVQVGLYSYTRDYFKLIKMQSESKTLAASGGVSGGSMILCCVHHLADVIPILGFSAFALFLSELQFAFLAMGVISNAVGIIMILEVMQRNELVSFKSIDFAYLKNPAIYASIFLIAGIFMAGILGMNSNAFAASSEAINSINSNQLTGLNSGSSSVSLQTISKEANSLTIAATPVLKGSSIEFQLKIDTHEGTNDFDVSKAAVLMINGKELKADAFEGFAASHHRSGKLFFNNISKNGKMSLIVRNAYNVSERIFEWS